MAKTQPNSEQIAHLIDPMVRNYVDAKIEEMIIASISPVQSKMAALGLDVNELRTIAVEGKVIAQEALAVANQPVARSFGRK